MIIKFANLPTLGAPLEGGIFAGVTTRKDGTHCAVILLPGQVEGLSWSKATTWAKEQCGELPTRPVAALLFSTVKDSLRAAWHWTADEYSAAYAWVCGFGHGYQDGYHKDISFAAVAVRLIPLEAA